jgi:hypothetical protein
MPKHLAQTLLFFTMALTTHCAWSSTTFTLRPNAASSSTTNGDAFVTTGPSGNLGGNNYGGTGSLAISATGSAAGSFAGFLRFDITAAKTVFDTSYGAGGWILDSAVLQLTTTSASNAIFNPNAAGSFSVKWIPADSWAEGTGTPASPSPAGVKWTDLPTLTSSAEVEGTFAIASVADGITANYPLTPSAGLLGDIAGGGPVSLYLAAADSAMSAVFNSRSFATASRNPAFILTASPIPEPGPACLLALVAWGSAARRRSALA